MGHLEFEGFDAETTKALEKKVAAVTGATMKQAVVVAFLEVVDLSGEDLKDAVHSRPLKELADELALLGAANDLGVTYAEATHLAGRLREIVRHPEEG